MRILRIIELSLGIFLCLGGSVSGAASLEPVDLTCEYLRDPVGVDVLQPRLSWKLKSDMRGQKQTGYHLIVASTRDKLDQNLGDLWDSGEVLTDQSIHIPYQGHPLLSNLRCYWKVRVTGIQGEQSEWSEPAEWTMGLLQPEDWKAKWISHDPGEKKLSYPWVRHTFEVNEDVEQALIHVNTASYYALRINGRKVSPDVLTPGVSKVDKRFLINSYDVSSHLVTGENCISLWMGLGWYQPRISGRDGQVLLRTQLEIDSAPGHRVIGTDKSWKVKESCVSQIGQWKWSDFGGERYDAREYIDGWDRSDLDDSDWVNAIEVKAPSVAHSWQGCESSQLGEPIRPKKVYQLDDGQWVFDFGKPLTGWMRLTMHDLPAGREVRMIYADVNDNDNIRKLSHIEDPDAKGFQSFNQRDLFISAGAASETFCSRFNYHSFRYAVVSGLAHAPTADDAVAMMVGPPLKSAGSFSCSNELYNRIHEITRYTFLTQNPGLALGTGEAREKSGYGDGGAHLSGYLYNYQCDANLRKWLRDWCDNQRDDGFLGHTAPAFEDHGGGPAWGGQATELVRRLYQYYGDKDVVEQTYETLRKYVDYVESKTKDGILRAYTPTRKALKWAFIGDWVRPTPTPGNDFYFDTMEEREFFNNCYRVLLWQQLHDYAQILGRTDETERCREHLAEIRPLIHRTFYLEDQGRYTFNNQGCLSMALYADVPPADLRQKILDQLEREIVVTKKGHLDTGLLGTFLMLDLLIKEGRNDLVALIMSQTTYPGWGYLSEELGHTTWPETWSGWGSQVILVTGTPGHWFYEGLGGIRPDPQSPGFKHFVLKPGVVDSVEWVECSYHSPYGRIVSNWKVEDGVFQWYICVPPNSTATIHLPTEDQSAIREDDRPLAQAKGVRFLRLEDGYSVLSVDSGCYSFACRQLSTNSNKELKRTENSAP